MSDIDPETTPAETPAPERLKYSGMTNTSTNDGTSATDTDLPGDAPTGRETARLSDVLSDPDEDDDRSVIERLQPGVGTAADPNHRGDKS